MRSISLFSVLFLQFLSCTSSAQEIFLDTFIRKDGIHIVPGFEPWQTETLFTAKKSKGKPANSQPLLPLEACDRVKYYSAASFGDKKTEPYRFFRVLNDLEAHDSTAYFQVLSDMPPAYQSFFRGLYQMEYNDFKTALSFFDNVLRTAASDSLLQKESSFWKEVSQKMLNEQAQHSAVLAAYALLEQPRSDSTKLMDLLQQVSLPQYAMHKYINLYNYHYREKDYDAARTVYDSILAYTGYAKMKASLTKNRAAVLEMLEAKQRFIDVVKKGLYHYEMDYLYDHLEAWGHDTVTDKEFSATAGFVLDKRNTTKTDSIFTRWLSDTAVNGQLSKFEVLSFIRTPLDKQGRRFVIVRLGFNNENTWNRYLSFLQKFKSKPVQLSVLTNKHGIIEGNEYMLTKYFIAELYSQDDPVIKYELTLYLLQDADGNVYAVDTLF